jgi:hypothetical protein
MMADIALWLGIALWKVVAYMIGFLVWMAVVSAIVGYSKVWEGLSRHPLRCLLAVGLLLGLSYGMIEVIHTLEGGSRLGVWVISACWTLVSIGARLSVEEREQHRREVRELEHRLTGLIAQLLKWQCLPAVPQARQHWRSTIQEHRRQLAQLLRDNSSLRPCVATVLPESYADARFDARNDTGLPLAAFPRTCPWTSEQILEEAFWPEILEEAFWPEEDIPLDEAFWPEGESTP